MRLLLAVILCWLAALPVQAAATCSGSTTTISDNICSAGTCSPGNFTVAAGTKRKVLISAETRHNNATNFSNMSINVGGTAATLTVRSVTGSASSNASQWELSEANLAAIGTGSKAVTCVDTVNDIHGCLLIFQMVEGVEQQAAAAINRATGTATTLSVDLTSVAAGSIVLWTAGHSTSTPGTYGSPTPDATIANVDGRWLASKCAVEATGGTVGVDPNWTNSVISRAVASAHAPFIDAAPVPGNSGTITTSNITPTGMDLAGTVGTDDVTAQANLQYEFRQSSTNNMGSVANAEANGTIIRAYTANDVTHTATGLSPGTGYWFQVIVKDEAGNKAIYTQKNETALGNILLSAPAVVECFCPRLFDINDVAIPDGVESTVYAGVQFTSLSGVAPHTFTVSSGALPSGLTLSAAGAISGTPGATAAGSYNFTVLATDAEGGKAFKSFAIVVNTDASGSLAFYEDAEDGNLTASPAWTIVGDCGVTSTGLLEGNDEVTKTGDTECVLFDNVNEAQVFFATDLLHVTAPTNHQDEVIVALDSIDEELFSVRIEADNDIYAKTPGQTGNEIAGIPRGFHLGNLDTLDEATAYLEFHYIAGTGANATFRARINGGIIQTFSTGTATTNVDRIILREENNSAADFVFDRLEAKDDDWPARGQLPGGSPPAPTPPPWVSDFTSQRVHYVSTNGSGSGTIGSPESLATANGHDACGDLHHLRGGTYTISSQISGSGGVWQPSPDCTSVNPSVWKGYVNPATGQPEQAKIDGSIRSNANHSWFMNLEVTDTVGVGQSFNIRADNVRVINNIVHDTYMNSNVSSQGFAGTIIYGNSLFRPSPNPTGSGAPAHNIYAQGNCTGGLKYIVHNISQEPAAEGPQSERLLQLNDSNGGAGIDCFHIEGNFFNDGANEESTVLWSSTGGINVTTAILKDNYLVDHYHNSSVPASLWMMERAEPMTAQITGNYFAKTNAFIQGYWGNSGTHTPGVFSGNEIYNPPSGIHLNIKTDGTSGTNGDQKFLDADVFDNNIYGGTFLGQLWCNGTNHGNSTLAQWRTRTSACRVTPGTGFDLASTNPANPTTDKVEVIENQYQCKSGCPFTDQARGHIYCVNWDANSTCAADISSVVGFGKTYTVRYSRDFYGTAAASGTCPGSGACNVSLPTRRTASQGTGEFGNGYIIMGQP